MPRSSMRLPFPHDRFTPIEAKHAVLALAAEISYLAFRSAPRRLFGAASREPPQILRENTAITITLSLLMARFLPTTSQRGSERRPRLARSSSFDSSVLPVVALWC